MSLRVRHLLSLAALLVAVPSLAAQSSTDGPRAAASRAGVSATVASPLAVAAAPRAHAAESAASLVPQPEAFRKRGVPQMVIGGVAIIGGAIIGDDVGTIISVGGLAYGLYGLYLYLN